VEGLNQQLAEKDCRGESYGSVGMGGANLPAVPAVDVAADYSLRGSASEDSDEAHPKPKLIFCSSSDHLFRSIFLS
jgi:hypothetical protein